MLAAGRSVGKQLCGGEVIALVGHLGAGKTHFSKGLVDGIGGDIDCVTSPTFSLVNEYRSGRIPLYHFDFYRMENAEEVLAIGWEEYLDDKEAIIVVEWADKFKELMPEDTLWYRFEIRGDGTRNLLTGKTV